MVNSLFGIKIFISIPSFPFSSSPSIAAIDGDKSLNPSLLLPFSVESTDYSTVKHPL